MVKEITSSIGLKNLTIQHIRAEEIRGRQFDIVVSRAVAPLKDLWNWSKPLIKKNKNTETVNGLICLKGGDLSKEISESGCKPFVWDVDKVFPEPYFKDKYILYQPAKK